jgi:hypothetical protein
MHRQLAFNLVVEYIANWMSFNDVKDSAGFEKVCNSIRPLSQITKPAKDAVRSVNNIKFTSQVL